MHRIHTVRNNIYRKLLVLLSVAIHTLELIKHIHPKIKKKIVKNFVYGRSWISLKILTSQAKFFFAPLYLFISLELFHGNLTYCIWLCILYAIILVWTIKELETFFFLKKLKICHCKEKSWKTISSFWNNSNSI